MVREISGVRHYETSTHDRPAVADVARLRKSDLICPTSGDVGNANTGVLNATAQPAGVSLGSADGVLLPLRDRRNPARLHGDSDGRAAPECGGSSVPDRRVCGLAVFSLGLEVGRRTRRRPDLFESTRGPSRLDTRHAVLHGVDAVALHAHRSDVRESASADCRHHDSQHVLRDPGRCDRRVGLHCIARRRAGARKRADVRRPEDRLRDGRRVRAFSD